jgi:hypothetical protein
MDGSRNERARARARYLLAQIAPLPDDAEVQRLRGLSMDYIREAERLERERVATREPSEEISAALDEVARDYFARAVQSKAKKWPSTAGHRPEPRGSVGFNYSSLELKIRR